MKDGLMHRQVNSILQDNNNFIWLCTKRGLCRFDGYGFTYYTPENSELSFEPEKCVQDAQGHFWVMGSGGIKENLAIFDPGTRRIISFKSKTGLSSAIHANFLRVMKDSTVFFGHNLDDHFFTWHPTRGTKKSKYPFLFRKLMTTPETNSFWGVNYTGEMCEFDLNGSVRRKTKVDFIPGGRYPNLQGLGMYLTDSATAKILFITPDHQVSSATDLPDLETKSDDVIFNTGVDGIIWRQGKLYRKDKGVLRDFVSEGRPEVGGRLRDVIVDANGRIWMCNDFGLFLLTITRNKFTRYFYQNETSHERNSYRNITVHNNILYACNEFSGAKETTLSDGKSPREAFMPPTPSSNFFSLKKISGNRIFGINSEYVYQKDPKNAKWSFLPKLDLRDYRAWDIYEVSPDSFLQGTNQGLQWFSLKTNKFSPFTGYNNFRELKDAQVLNISPDRDGNLWISTAKGFYLCDPARGITARYSSADTGKYFLPATAFQHHYHDKDGTYWLATESGLLKWNKNTGECRRYTQNDGLSNNNIYSVYDDGTGYLWLSSDYGIMRFNKATAQTQTFLTDAGITDNEFNRTSHFRDEDGTLYFGSMNGVTAFHPARFSDAGKNKNAPLVVTSLEQFNGKTNKLEDKTLRLLADKNITLQPDDRFFTINFSLLTYTDLEHNTYYWRIDGIDTGWNSMKEHVLRLGKLPYGTRTLHIKAQAGDGSWSKNELQFNIITLKPYYLQTWFLALVAVVLLLSFTIWYKRRVSKLQQENIILDKIVKEKTSALEEKIHDLEISSEQKNILMKEIHHRVKNNLQMIGVLLKLQLANVQDLAARKSLEESITRVSSIALIHQYLYKDNDLTAIEISKFTTELFNHVTDLYRSGDQGVVFQNDIPETLLDIDTAIPLGLILNELMVNSYKYSYNNGVNGQLNIRLNKTSGEYTLQYFDNGPGLPKDFDIEKADTLGMVIIKSLSRQIGSEAKYVDENKSFFIYFKDTGTRKKIA